MKTPRKVEWWVMRVVAKPAQSTPAWRAHTRIGGEGNEITRALWTLPQDRRSPTASEWRQINALVETGAFTPLPGGEIAEPIECYDDEDSAQRARDVEAARHPLGEFKVIMNADVEGTARD